MKIGVAASVRVGDWEAAEIFPRQVNPALGLSGDQHEALGLFAGKAGARRALQRSATRR